MGCDGKESLAILAIRDVSIHAPAWGATELKARTRKELGVSIHAPAWGATHNNLL